MWARAAQFTAWDGRGRPVAVHLYARPLRPPSMALGRSNVSRRTMMIDPVSKSPTRQRGVESPGMFLFFSALGRREYHYFGDGKA